MNVNISIKRATAIANFAGSTVVELRAARNAFQAAADKSTGSQRSHWQGKANAMRRRIARINGASS